jgi:hypothetical protein
MAEGDKSSRLRTLGAKLRGRWKSAVEIYGTFDLRSLGLARIGLGLLLLWDLLRRVPDLSNWYSNEGLLPNHTVLWRPSSEYMFSFLFAASRPEEAALMFALCALPFLAFTVGWHTRASHVISFACMVSLHDREIFTENGGDCAINLLCFWTLFLPMGARFSVDAVRKSLAATRERSAAELNDRAAAVTRPASTKSLAFFAILLQLAVIYYFNAVNKHGSTWHRGTAVRYVLYQERMVTWLGLLVRDHVGFWLSRFLTYFTLGLEFGAPILILTPVGWQWARRVAMLVLPLMHVGFAAGLNLGQFSFNMIGYFPLLMQPDDWAWLAARFAPGPSRARTVHVREDVPLAFAWARVLSRLDRFERLRFVAAGETVASWQVEDPATARRTTGAPAVVECLAALPCGLPLAALLGLPGVRALARATENIVTDKQVTLARWLGLRPASRAPAPERVPVPARTWMLRRLAQLRELSVAVMIVANTSQLLVENHAIPQRFKPPQPKWITQLVVYPRLLQGWQMFSADVPTGERMLYVDAITFGGRHVDPFNEAGSRVSSLPVERIPRHMEQDEFWCDYTNRIPENEAYWRALKEWIFNYHRRTGRPEDRIISFEARLLEQEVPPFGETEPRNIKTKVMLSGRE